jgi:Carboxypeptidase regulatory-like domain
MLLLALTAATSSTTLRANTVPGRPSRTLVSGYRIAGTVISKVDGHPLARARITITRAKNPAQSDFVITSEDGKFEFDAVPAGKYSLRAAKHGFIAAAYDQHDQYSTAIVTGAGLDTENLILRLAPDAVITGKVLDEVGDPVRHATITLYIDDHRGGIDQVRVFRSVQTDDLGIYEITPLIAGSYFLSVSAKPWYAVHPSSDPVSKVDRSLDVAYPQTYYADVTDTDSATPIPIRGGERVQFDFHLNPAPALTLIFHLPGDTSKGFTIPQLEQPAFDGSSLVQTSGARMISPGVVEVSGIPAGRYDLLMPSSSNGAGSRMNGVDLSKDGEEIDVASAEALSDIKVSVQMADGTPLPKRLALGFRSRRQAVAQGQMIDSKGQADFHGIAAARYEVVVWGYEKPCSIARMSADGAEVSGHSVTITPGSSPSLSITLVDGSVEINGTAKRAGKPFAGAMVVLAPKDAENDRALFRRDQSDQDGTFTLHNVVPGSYTLLAIENGWDLDWSRPEVIAYYFKDGLPIEIGNDAGQSVNLSRAIEVQSK